MSERLSEDRERGMLSTPDAALQRRNDDSACIERKQPESLACTLLRHRPGTGGASTVMLRGPSIGRQVWLRSARRDSPSFTIRYVAIVDARPNGTVSDSVPSREQSL